MKNIVDFLKLPPRILGALSVASGLLLFLPNVIIEKLYMTSVDLSSGNSRIFYKTLLVVDLDKIIKGAGKQKTSTIHLNLFPTAANEIAFYEGTVKHIYFVAETKGSMSSMQLRLIEESKIHCAREHFKAISNGNVVYDVVDSYQTLLERVMK